jgi:oligopeptide/dipeptide ABC transporter ATP-binding protein
MTPLLEARGAGKTFESGFVAKTATVALEPVSFAIDPSEARVTAIVGESGSGKTTLARLLLGIISPSSGEVLYKGKNFQHLTKEERRSYMRDVQPIFQDPFEVYNPFYKVDHVLELPIRNFKLASSKDEGRALMSDVLSAVGLRPDETLGRYPHQLSGGQRQRIMVARALLLKPKVIIADEPVSMVDASLRATILESLLQLNREFGISLIYITHDLTTAYQVSDDVMVLYRGQVTEVGDANLVVPQPQHPYTKLLVGSIPLPDPKLDWQGERVLGKATLELKPEGDHFCRFYDRCPMAMPECVQTTPPLFLTGGRRATSCFLHKSENELPPGDLTEILAGERASTARATA